MSPVTTYRPDSGLVEPGSVWRDERGAVRVRFAYESGEAQGVIYYRGDEQYVIGLRRFLRDFVRVSAGRVSGKESDNA